MYYIELSELEEELGAEKVMGKKIIQLIEKIKKTNLSEWEESLIHDHIHIEFEDYYFSNREYRRVR